MAKGFFAILGIAFLVLKVLGSPGTSSAGASRHARPPRGICSKLGHLPFPGLVS